MEIAYIILDPDDSQLLGLCVIVEAMTGVTYANQVAGYATEIRSLEGFLIPVGNVDSAKVIYNWFWRTFHGNCYHPETDWTSERTRVLSELVSQIPCWLTSSNVELDERRFLILDENRMNDCVEAWIPVITPYGRGILTLNNSD